MIFSPEDLARIEAMAARMGQLQAHYAEAEQQLAAIREDHDRREHNVTQASTAALSR